MPFLTSQEKNLTIFLLSTALIGSVIGVFRHDWLKTPKILLSPKYLPSSIKAIEEKNIIEKHNIMIKNKSLMSNVVEVNTESKIVNNLLIDNVANKTESNKKKITQNSSRIININIASKEDFMTLPYIG